MRTALGVPDIPAQSFPRVSLSDSKPKLDVQPGEW